MKFLFFITSWILFSILRTACILLGFFTIPVAVLFKAYKMRESKVYKGKIVRAFTWPFMWIWGNEEEGIGWYGEATWPIWRKILYSECVRNPANNLRFVPGLSVKIDPSKVKWIGSLGNKDDNLSEEVVKKYDSDAEVFWSLTWQGLYSNIRVHFNYKGKRYRFWLGWKIYPQDIYGLPEWSHRKASAGFATQLKRIDHWVK